jgi:hypothetical protein
VVARSRRGACMVVPCARAGHQGSGGCRRERGRGEVGGEAARDGDSARF